MCGGRLLPCHTARLVMHVSVDVNELIWGDNDVQGLAPSLLWMSVPDPSPSHWMDKAVPRVVSFKAELSAPGIRLVKMDEKAGRVVIPVKRRMEALA